MSTDDSISEDVSSSVALSAEHPPPHRLPHHHHHHHHDDHSISKGEAEGEVSEASVVSLEDTMSGAGPVVVVGGEERGGVESPVQTLEGLLQAAQENRRAGR